jgi:hypothetical protein
MRKSYRAGSPLGKDRAGSGRPPMVAGRQNRYDPSHAPVAQLDRASVFGTEGWGFESLRA